MKPYIEDKEYTGESFIDSSLEKGEYSYCVFDNCNFDGTDLTENKFIECKFKDCNLSNVDLNLTTLQDVNFENCKMLGIDFHECGDFGFKTQFISCRLEHSSFQGMKLTRSSFLDCHLQGVDFSNADLGGILIKKCNLENAQFDNTVLTKCDLTDSYHMNIDPRNNSVKSMKVSSFAAKDILQIFGIKVS